MRSHNKILAVAITTALSASFSNLYAIQLYIEDCKNGTNGATATTPTQFENVGENASWAKCVIVRAGEDNIVTSGTLTRPKDVFDFTGGQSVVHAGVGQTTGVSYGAELFGSTGLILPTPISTGLTPDFLGVIYTVDGNINVNFDVTFTLDNGATFAESPILGVRDDKGTGYALGDDVTAGATSVNVTGLTADSIFRFENHSNVYLATDAVVNFRQLGVLSAVPTITGAQLAVSSVSYSKVYANTLAVTNTGVLSAAVATITATGGLTGGAGTNPATITVSTADAAKLKAGWTYACSSSSQATAGTHLFSVAPNTTTGAVTITAKIAATSDGWATVGAGGWKDTASFGDTVAECANNALIYRVHVKGDTVISLESTPTTNFAKDVLYTFDVVATPPATCNLAPITSPTQYKVTAVDSTNNLITIQNMSGGTGLANPLCATMKGYKTVIELSDLWKPNGLMTPTPPITSAASGKNAASFSMNAKTPNQLEGGDQLMLLYKMSNVGILADPTQKVNMTIDLKTGGAVDTIVNPQRTVTVATSAKALDVSLISLEAGKLNISVSSGSTQFSGESAPSGTTYGYVNNTTAKIGQLLISNTSSAKMADAMTPFSIGSDAVTADSSKLVITGGQFQASKATPGSVELRLGNGSSITADEITMDLEGAWQATWNLDSTELSSIAPSADIEIVVDGATEINSVENPPVGNLTIDFNNTSYKDITIEAVDLRKITKDGNVCTVYNVPPPSNGVMGADVVSIRVTNDSAIAGKLMGKFFGMDGAMMWSGDLLEGTELQPGTTIRLESDILAKVMGITWEGRGVLQISSTIPEMEVMALIRQNGIKFAPLSNLSTGARGTSCSQE